MSSSKIIVTEGNANVTRKLVSIAQNSRRISRPDGLDRCVNTIVRTINYFNRIQPDDFLFNFTKQSVSVSDLVLPQEFSFLLIPLSIRLDPSDLKTKDVKIIPEYQLTMGDAVLPDTLIDFKCEIDNFRRYFKLNGNENLVKVMDVRKNISLFDCLNTISIINCTGDLINGKVHYFSDAFWPTFVSLSSVDNLLEDNYFNDVCENIFKDYLFNLRFG